MSPEENAEEVIIAGFELMKSNDFECLFGTDKIPTENTLSYNWTVRVISCVANAFLRSQESSAHIGYVDYYLNSFADTASVMLRRLFLKKPISVKPPSQAKMGKKILQQKQEPEHLEVWT